MILKTSLEKPVLVVIANDLPPAVRGRMKLWFIEPRANIFVSGIRDNVAEKVVEYLHKHCPPESGLLIFQRTTEAPGYRIHGRGSHKRELVRISGLQLVLDKDASTPPPPPAPRPPDNPAAAL